MSFFVFFENTDYGCCINRNSKIIIVFTSSYAEAATGHFAYYLAKMGGFNYVSKEIEVNPNAPVSYYNIPGEDACPNLKAFLDDIKTLAPTKDSWVIFILSASGGQEPVYPTLFHYIYGAKKGDEGYDDKNLTIIDTISFENMYQDLSNVLLKKYDFESDKHRYHAGTSPKNVARKINGGVDRNAFTVRIAWSVTCWDFRYLEIAKHMADKFNKHLLGLENVEVPADMISRVVGKDYGYDFYQQ
jgi:voltage-gated potassium channel